MLSLFASDLLEKSPVLAFPIVALVIFVAVFTLVAIRAMRMKKSDVRRLASMPLAPDEGPVSFPRPATGSARHG
jgi:hypothetical protein